MQRKTKKKNKVFSVFITLFWLALILLCFLNRDKFTIEALTALIPSPTLGSALILLLLFILKSITIVFYSGILYAVSGLIFPLPTAILINITGSALMVTVPYFIGKTAGHKALVKLCDKYPKLSMIRDIQNESQLLTSALARLIHILPSDPVSLYFGASGGGYCRYLIGSLLGLTPMYICFALMGTSVNDPTSPIFIASVIIQLLFIALSVPLYSFIHRRKQRKSSLDLPVQEP